MSAIRFWVGSLHGAVVGLGEPCCCRLAAHRPLSSSLQERDSPKGLFKIAQFNHAQWAVRGGLGLKLWKQIFWHKWLL